MKTRPHPLSILVLLILATGSGCMVTPGYEQQQAAIHQQQRADSELMAENFRAIRARLDMIEQDMLELQRRINAVATEQPAGLTAQFHGINQALEELNRKINSVDAARQADKREIVDSLSQRIATVMASSRPAPAASQARRPISNEGYEHTVQPGETLSAIATAYGARVSDIVQANNLTSADVLRVGQKLFIPAR
ncbi:MAG TPA: LysM peptidoglycan-binding domain-containing protein [Kiritimatiellia bacterium]|nr:LysM peptidoglycan-binding domain-containing protein [Kiritimatiellia bacterium]